MIERDSRSRREADTHRSSSALALAAVAVVAAGAVWLVAVLPPAPSSGRAATGPAPAPVASFDAPLGHRLPSVVVTAPHAPGRDAGSTAPTVVPSASPTVAPSTTAAPRPPAQDPDQPSIVARPVPLAVPAERPPPAPAPAWAGSTVTTSAGYVSTAVGCLPSRDPTPSAAELDEFLSGRVGPVMGWDYQHVYPLGGGRHLWLFQDAFVDHSGGATTLGQAGFAHNVALVQEGSCFRLLHRGSTRRPGPFEPGTGGGSSTWFWPMGGELHDGRLHVFWAQMVKDVVDPSPPDGLGWHPVATWVATYDPGTLARVDFTPAPNPGVRPIFGYAVVSDETHTYLFGNTFEQNLAREGGYWAGRHSATKVYLARVPRGRLFAAPEYRAASGWSADPASAVAVLDRHWAEFPFQPRFIDAQWVGVAAVNGYWGDEFSVDVARQPWGPWTTVESRPLAPRGGDPKMNTYHAHLVPWRGASGELVVTLSNNARDMPRDAWPHPHRYRPMAFAAAWVRAPVDPPDPVPTTTPPTASPSTVPTTIGSTTAPPTVPTTTAAAGATTPTTGPPAEVTTTTTVASTPTTAVPDGGVDPPGER